jgi:hypothetical protein
MRMDSEFAMIGANRRCFDTVVWELG